MYVLRLRSVSLPGRWGYIDSFTGARVFRRTYHNLQFKTFEEAEALRQRIKDAWYAGEITSEGLTDERINSIEIYRLPNT